MKYPGLGLLGRRPRCAGVHRRPPSHPCLCKPAGSLPHVRGFLALAVVRSLRPVPAPSAGGEPCSPAPLAAREKEATPGRFPRSPSTDRRGWCPALPLQHRPGATEALPGASEPGPSTQTRRWAPCSTTRQAPPRPTSIRFEPSTCKGASYTGSVSLHLPASLAGVGRLMVPDVVRAASARSPHPRGRTALSFTRPLRWPGADLSTRSVDQRLVAHRTGRTGSSGRTFSHEP